MLKDESVQEMIRTLLEEDAAIDETLRELGAKKERVQAALAPLKALLEPIEPEFDGGLADACRQVLKSADRPLSPVEIRDAIRVIGYDLGKHKNEMASIHSVLKRMAESKESKDVKKHELKDGAQYSWTGGRPLVIRGKPIGQEIYDATREAMAKMSATTKMMGEIGKSQAIINAAMKTSSVESLMKSIAADSPLAQAMAAMQKTDISSAVDEALEAQRQIAKQIAALGKIPKF